jgi:hypothetical protein
MGLRRGAFGILVAEVRPPLSGYALLPECFRPPDELTHFLLPSVEVGEKMFRRLLGARLDDAGAKQPPSSPRDLREAKEIEARQAYQPDGWGDRTYQSVTGLRWRCCGNLFEEEHSPWCRASDFADPLPPA